MAFKNRVCVRLYRSIGNLQKAARSSLNVLHYMIQYQKKWMFHGVEPSELQDGCKNVCNCKDRISTRSIQLPRRKVTHILLIMMQHLSQLLPRNFRPVQNLIIGSFAIEMLIDPKKRSGKKMSVSL